MAKYSYEFKKKIVDAYLRGEGGYKYLSSGTVKHPAQNSFLDKPPCLTGTNLAFEVKITQH